MKIIFAATLLLLATASFSQATKKITQETGDKYSKLKKEFFVLADNDSIKKGSYQEYWNNNLVISGYYNNNKKDSIWTRYYKGKAVSRKKYKDDERTGIWDFLIRNETISWQYDFTSNIALNSPKDTAKYYYQSPGGQWIKGDLDSNPIALVSSYEWQTFLLTTLRYPQDAIDKNMQGTVVVEITADEKGSPIDYTIATSAHKSLDDEAMRLVKLFRHEFVPAIKEGKKVKIKVKIPIVFRLG